MKVKELVAMLLEGDQEADIEAAELVEVDNFGTLDAKTGVITSDPSKPTATIPNNERRFIIENISMIRMFDPPENLAVLGFKKKTKFDIADLEGADLVS